MSEPTLFRVGSVCAIVGAILGIIVNVLHPRTEEIAKPEALVQLVASSDIWVGDHVGILVAILLVVAGYAAVYRSLTGEAATAFARLGYASAVVGATVFAVLAATDGIAGKALANAWATAPAAEKAAALRVAESVAAVNIALFSVTLIVFFGATVFLFGLAIATSDVYPKWLGWVAAVLGVAAALLGFVYAYQGPSALVTNILVPILSILETVWLLVIGVLLWRRTTVTRPAYRTAPA